MCSFIMKKEDSDETSWSGSTLFTKERFFKITFTVHLFGRIRYNSMLLNLPSMTYICFITYSDIL